jgi:acyl carrier protein
MSSKAHPTRVQLKLFSAPSPAAHLPWSLGAGLLLRAGALDSNSQNHSTWTLPMSDAVMAKIKDFIMEEFLPGEDASELTAMTPLISGGILDSIATLKLVMFIEEQYGVAFAPHEVDKENLDNLESIVRLLLSKKPTVA